MATLACITSRYLTRRTSLTTSSTTCLPAPNSQLSSRAWQKRRTKRRRSPWTFSRGARKTVTCFYSHSYPLRRSSSWHPCPHQKISGWSSISWWTRRSCASPRVFPACLAIAQLVVKACRRSGTLPMTWAGNSTQCAPIGISQQTLTSTVLRRSRSRCRRVSR